MLARLRKSMDEKDQGFTLIELLVVMIIIGILAAIAIPVFLNQRQRAVESGMKSDLRTVANEVETSFVDNQRYPTNAAGTGTVTITHNTTPATTTPVVVNANATVAYTALGTTGFCLLITNTGAVNGGTPVSYAYNSTTGGLGARGSTC